MTKNVGRILVFVVDFVDVVETALIININICSIVWMLKIVPNILYRIISQ